MRNALKHKGEGLAGGFIPHASAILLLSPTVHVVTAAAAAAAAAAAVEVWVACGRCGRDAPMGPAERGIVAALLFGELPACALDTYEIPNNSNTYSVLCISQSRKSRLFTHVSSLQRRPGGLLRPGFCLEGVQFLLELLLPAGQLLADGAQL